MIAKSIMSFTKLVKTCIKLDWTRLTYPNISKEIFKFTPVILDDKLKEVKDELTQ